MDSRDVPRSPPGEITRLLRAWYDGDASAQEELWPVLYDELEVLARSVRRQNRGMAVRGPQTSTLVHEAALRLLGAEVSANDRRHFFALAARAMRHVLVDEARRRFAQKRGVAAELAELPEEMADGVDRRPEEILAVHQALARLQQIHPRYEKLVELRYFAGLTIEEIAEVLGVSTPTVKRDWRAARTWLYGELGSSAVGA